MKKKSLLGLIVMLFFTTQLYAQTVVYYNDFTGYTTGGYTLGGTPFVTFMPNSSSSASGVGYAGSSVGVTIASTWPVTPNQLAAYVDMLYIGTNNGHYQQAGALSTFSAPFSPTLSSNPSLVEWTFNMRTSNAQTGFATSQDAAITILCSDAGFCATGSGYAVTFDPSVAGGSSIRLVKYTGGLTGTVTNIISSATSTLASPTNYASIRVTYSPFTNRWTLHVRDDGPTMFNNPATGTLSFVGNAIDATYTSTAMSYFGFHVNYSVTSPAIPSPQIEYAYFDNFRVSVGCMPIMGATEVCTGNTSLLSHDAVDGTWNSVPASVATIDPSGLLHGITPGTAIVTYTIGTCVVNTTVTVNTLPAPITGTLEVCEGLTTTLTHTASGGTWNSGAVAIAGVDAVGVVTGIAAGISNITYTPPTGCPTISMLTVNPMPAAITGMAVVCEGLTTTLSSATGGGSWSSSDADVATIDGSGMVSGIAGGICSITYALFTGCFVTKNVTVNSLPSAGTITGTAIVCPTATTTLSNSIGGGVWSSSNLTRAVVSATGVVTGIAAGTSTISYTVTNSCGTATATVVVTVNPSPNAGTVTGTGVVCPVGTTSLSNPTADPGGVWTSLSTAIATVGASSGIVTGVAAGTATISYTVTNSCGTTAVTKIVTVNPMPNSGIITGATTTCPAGTSTLSNPTGDAGGIWASITTATATINASTGLVLGVAPGTTTISYTVTNSCGTSATTTIFTVNLLPSAGIITGTPTVCPAATTVLSNGVGGGVWSSSTPANATINVTGTVTGVLAGTSTISYAVTNSCGTAVATRVVTVTPLPNAGGITGIATVCQGLTTTLSNATPGGTWSSATSGIATVDISGTVTGIAAGTAVISYAVTNSCGTAATTRNVTVNALPAPIAGIANVCVSATTVLTDADPGGTWTRSNTNVTIGAGTGIVTGMTTGTVTITYTLPTTCMTTATVTVNSLPIIYNVTGGGGYCGGGAGVHIGLSGSEPGINYQLYNAATAVLSPVVGGGSSIDFGALTAAGVYTVQAVNVTTSCAQSMSGSAAITLDPFMVPSVSIVPSYSVSACAGATVTYIAVPVNGGALPTYQWYVNGIAVGTPVNHYSYMPTNGDIVSVMLFPEGICVLPTTATAAHLVSVLPPGTPSVNISVSPGSIVCSGDPVVFAATPVLGGTAPAYVWVRNGINVATGPTYTYAPGTGDAVFCKMTSNYICRSVDVVNSNTVTMTVTSGAPAPTVDITANPGTTISAGQTVTLNATTTGGTVLKSYKWAVNGIHISGATNSVFVSNTFSNGSIATCEVTNSDACANSTLKSIVIHVGATGVHENTSISGGINLYPNPNNGVFVFNIHSAINENVHVTITNMLGEKVKEVSCSTNIDKEVLLDIAKGIYLLTAITTSQRENVIFVVQ